MELDFAPGQVIEPTTASAWIEPNGTFHFVPECSHFMTALRQLGDETGGEQLEADGWVHFSFTGIHHAKPLTQKQIDALFDTYMAFENAKVRVYRHQQYIDNLRLELKALLS
jgi:hypothetical protein